MTYNSNREQTYNGIVEKMATFIFEETIDEYTMEVIKSAADLDRCDYLDIQAFVALLNQNIVPQTAPFSVLDFNKDNKYYIIYHNDPFEQLVKDNWEDWLEEDDVEFIQDEYEVSCIRDKYCYGGGGFEFMRDFEMDVAQKVTEMIKNRVS